MRFIRAADHASPFLDEFVRRLEDELIDRGHQRAAEVDPARLPPDVGLVLNVTDAREPAANYVRSSPENFACTVTETDSPGEDLHAEAYRILVRTLSNLLIHVVHGRTGATSHVVTPELGFREIPHDGREIERLATQVADLAAARFVIANDLRPDLPEGLEQGDAVTEEIRSVGRQLDGLDLLPTVLPLDEILSPRDRRLLFKVFGVKQLSYGNLSARRDESSFWMTGRGVDKGNLSRIGRDILLVTGHDADAASMRVSVPSDASLSARVSVDAIEHHLIYEAFPEVGAIVHVHAWLPGIEATLQSHPCGTWELAMEVRELVRRAPDPANAVVGLKNHGITATGPGPQALFDRLAGRLERQVPMS